MKIGKHLGVALILAALAACSGPINPDPEKSLVGITVSTLPEKTEYNLGDTALDTTGMVVTANYDDGSSQVVTDYTTSGFSAATVGSKTITVTYQGKTASFSINVIDPSKPTAATPTASPTAGEVESGTTITLSTATSGAEIWYTTNGNTPAKNASGSTRYTAPITITVNTTIRAIAVKDDMNDSGVLTAVYTIAAPNAVATPVANPPAGEIEDGTTVTLSTTTEGAVIWYTTNGNTPVQNGTGSTRYTVPITITANTTIRAIAVKDDMSDSGVLTAAYTIIASNTVATPVANPPSGVVLIGTEIELTTTTDWATIRYTTNGNDPTTGSATYTGPITVNGPMTIKAIAMKEGMENSAMLTAVYTIIPTVETPTASLAGGEVDYGTMVTLSTATESAEIWYTTDGSTPVKNEIGNTKYENPITISGAVTIKAIAVKDGMYDSNVLTAAYTISAPGVPNTTLTEKLVWVKENAVSGMSYTLVVYNSESLSPHELSYEGKSNITIRLLGIGDEKIISLSSNGSLFTVQSGVTLILDENIILQGRSSNTNSLVRVNSGAELVMEIGSKITGNTATTTSSTSASSYGGGVYINGGTFTMKGGEISGNTAASTSTSSNYYYSSNSNSYGGGVYINGGTFTMKGGEISGNTASSSSNTTASNSSNAYSYGGGVYINGTFTMEGGKISGNTASSYSNTTSSSHYASAYSYGGGVYIIGTNGTFTMEGGEISGNTVSSNNYSSNNYASYSYGGGVYINGGTFTMEGGEISGNTVRGGYYYTSSSNYYSYGGGVYVGSGTFTKTGGTIYGYNAVDAGNSLWNKVVIGNANTIQNNQGHAVYVSSSMRRETTAGPEVNLNSRVSGADGGWEN